MSKGRVFWVLWNFYNCPVRVLFRCLELQSFQSTKITDLGNPIGIFDCGLCTLLCSIEIFLPFWFYVKSILAVLSRLNSAILTILKALNFNFLGISHLKMSKNPKNSKIRAAQMFKMAVFNFLWVQNGRNILKFTHCVFPIRLPRSVLIKVGTFALIEIFLQFLWHLKHTSISCQLLLFFCWAVWFTNVFCVRLWNGDCKKCSKKILQFKPRAGKKVKFKYSRDFARFFFNLILHEKRGLGLKSRIFSFFKSGQF